MYNDFVKIISSSPEIRSGAFGFNLAQIKNVVKSADKRMSDFLLLPHNVIFGSNTGKLLFNGDFIKKVEDSLKSVCEFIDSEKIRTATIFSSDTLCPDCGGKNITVFVLGKDIKITRSICGCENPPDLTFKTEDFCFSVVPVTESKKTLVNFGDIIKCSDAVFYPCEQQNRISAVDRLFDNIRAVSGLYGNIGVIANSSASNTPTPYSYIGITGAVRCGKVTSNIRQQAFEEIESEFDFDIKTVKKKLNKNINPENNIKLVKYKNEEKSLLTPKISKEPFLEGMDKKQADARLDEIFDAVKLAAACRIRSLKNISDSLDKVLLGISGGLDSTAAMIFLYEAMKLLGMPTSNIIAVTMKGFGTSDKTKTNAKELIRHTGATFLEIPITVSVKQHFADIGHDAALRDVVYENAQARERTQILLDLANKYNGIVINTGDLSEIALGFCTFGGDHLGHFAVNACLTKTMLQKIVERYAEKTENEVLRLILMNILTTEISPELIPADEPGGIAQKTEEIIGPYRLHDFFLYYFLKYNFSAEKLFYYAKTAFEDEFSADDIKKVLNIFLKRFYSNQFKRTCATEGPIITSINLSPFEYLIPSDFNSSEFFTDEFK